MQGPPVDHFPSGGVDQFPSGAANAVTMCGMAPPRSAVAQATDRMLEPLLWPTTKKNPSDSSKTRFTNG